MNTPDDGTRHITRALPNPVGTVAIIATLAFVLLLGVLTSRGEDDQGEAGSVATYMSEREDDTAAVRLADAYDEKLDTLVIVCAFNSATDVQDRLGFPWPGASGLAVEENQQAVVAARDGEVVGSEVMSRKVLDLCADSQVEYPVALDPAASLEVTAEEWSDGSTYPAADLG